MKKNEYVLSDQDYNEQDTYLTSSHPLADLFKIKHCWTTPIGEIKINLPEDMRISLITFSMKRILMNT